MLPQTHYKRIPETQHFAAMHFSCYSTLTVVFFDIVEVFGFDF